MISELSSTASSATSLEPGLEFYSSCLILPRCCLVSEWLRQVHFWLMKYAFEKLRPATRWVNYYAAGLK
jgi:hypothetical protein